MSTASENPVLNVFRLAPVTITIGLVALVCHAMPVLTPWLQYDRVLIGDGQWWRWLTGHLTHWSANHLAWDLLTFVALGVVCETQSKGRLAVAVGLSAVMISGGLWLWEPGMRLYRGLSGVDCALFTLMAALFWKNSRRSKSHSGALIAGCMILGFLGKTTLEVVTGQTYFVDSQASDFTPLPLTHLLGGAVGLVASWGGWRWGYESEPPQRKMKHQTPNHI
jgi:rhomboid family GlyGly-CTERM serine protease